MDNDGKHPHATTIAINSQPESVSDVSGTVAHSGVWGNAGNLTLFASGMIGFYK